MGDNVVYSHMACQLAAVAAPQSALHVSLHIRGAQLSVALVQVPRGVLVCGVGWVRDFKAAMSWYEFLEKPAVLSASN